MHERMLGVWRSDVGKSILAHAFAGGAPTAALQTTGRPDTRDESDEGLTDDDKSSIYSVVSDVEDELAEVWDDMLDAAESDGEVDETVREWFSRTFCTNA